MLHHGRAYALIAGARNCSSSVRQISRQKVILQLISFQQDTH